MQEAMTPHASVSRYEIVGLRKKLIEIARSANPERTLETSQSQFSLVKFGLVASEVLAGIEDEPLRSRAAQAVLSVADYPGRFYTQLLARDAQTFAIEVRAEGLPDAAMVELLRLLADEDGRLFCAPLSAGKPDLPPAVMVAPRSIPVEGALSLPLHLKRVNAEFLPNPFLEDMDAAPAGAVLCLFQVTEDRSEHSDYARCVRALSSRVNRVNARQPELRLVMGEPLILSEALRQSDTARVTGHIERMMKRTAKTLQNSGVPKFDLAHLSITVWPEEGFQTFDALFMCRSQDNIGIGHRLDVSFATALSTLCADLAPLFGDLGLDTVVSPAQSHLGYADKPDAELFQDVDGRWLPAILYSVGGEARKLVKSARWLTTLEAKDRAEKLEMAAWPYPFLYKQVNPAQAIRNQFREDVASQVLSICSEPGVGFCAMQKRVIASHPAYAGLTGETAEWHDSLRIPYELYLSLHFVKSDGRVFHILDSLRERLDVTDIHEELPVSLLHAPFADCYFHLQLPILVGKADNESEEHRLVGFFVNERQATGDTSGARCIAIAPVVTIGTDMLTAFAGEVEIVIEPEDKGTLLDTMNRQLSARPGFRGQTINPTDAWFRMVALAAKVMLYMGLKSARIVERRPRSEQMEKIRSASGSEKKKAARRAASAYDFIEVGPEKSMAEVEHEALREGLKHVFWRRGFLRNQAWGPNWSLHREQWIEPTLVNAALLNGEPAPEPKDYRIV